MILTLWLAAHLVQAAAGTDTAADEEEDHDKHSAEGSDVGHRSVDFKAGGETWLTIEKKRIEKNKNAIISTLQKSVTNNNTHLSYTENTHIITVGRCRSLLSGLSITAIFNGVSYMPVKPHSTLYKGKKGGKKEVGCASCCSSAKCKHCRWSYTGRHYTSCFVLK